ncbi:hypothetical protein GO013_02215 [Pseudodesulfovibrio sp. JC047]|uniref:hypothetical protein n=1 Tax=Pseudodesulfovibrio sp. JC047 TaxID=2683199 RepID=UPI0013D50561|nr:hypothetical protein [Pseudodesulfovibrio sp. JC047]NDV18233.1 hypothetical protein [Pseudodesulfovibrio sp. JC047]
MGANSAQTLNMVQNGLNTFQDVTRMMDTSASNNPNEEFAKLKETEAKRQAWETRQQGKKEAQVLRRNRESTRSRHTANWGGANLAMSGSKKLLQDANRLQDRQDEDDLLFQGENNAMSILQDGRHGANMTRIQNGDSPKRSMLSMGSKIYGDGR